MSDKNTILVVDDDPDIVFFFKTVLEAEGYDVRSKGTAQKGLDAVKEDTPDLVILDIMMEEADSGLNAAKELAALKPDLPILLISSIASMAEQLSLPISDLAEKPVEPQVLLTMVKRLLDQAAR